MNYKYKKGQTLRIKKDFHLTSKSNDMYINNGMVRHMQNGGLLEVIRPKVWGGAPYYDCYLVDQHGVRKSDFTYKEDWLEPMYQSFDELHTALSNGEINDEEYLEVMKSGR